ncbi:hypothetical protein AX14_008055 [Amanita brunnescens Koide BX004]|nr:hypothetical protein AX14_008055 [Amanita brunnescens Koide BX004]
MASEEAIENHNTLFLLDGNVILSAPSSENSDTAFRVHQSLLMRHSGFFRNVLSDVDALEKRDSMPFIRLSTPAERVECLLQYIYGDLTIPLRRLSPSNISTMKHLLQLSTSHDIPQIRTQLIPRLEQDWPSTLFHWDALEVEIDGLKNVWMDDPVPSYFDDYLPEPASAIRLGFECHVPSILPAAFYHLSRLTILQDRRASRKDPECMKHRELSLRTADWGALAASDFIYLMKGQHRLSLAVDEMVLDEPRLYSLPKEHFTQGCSLDGQWEFWNEIKRSCKKTHDILKLLNEHAQQVQSRTDFCYACRLDIQRALKDMRQELWSRLAEYFGFAYRDTLY